MYSDNTLRYFDTRYLIVFRKQCGRVSFYKALRCPQKHTINTHFMRTTEIRIRGDAVNEPPVRIYTDITTLTYAAKAIRVSTYVSIRLPETTQKSTQEEEEFLFFNIGL